MTNGLVAGPLDRPVTSPGKARRYDWRMLLVLPAAVAIAISRFAPRELLRPLGHIAPHAVLQTVGSALFYLLTLGIVIGWPLLIRHRLTTNASVLGIDRRMSWSDLGLGLALYIPCALASAQVVLGVTALIPAFRVHHKQDLGFHVSGATTDIILAFASLVVLAPLAEEALFRGWLYGKLQAFVPAAPAAIVTSAMFGLAHLFGTTHLQWNVTISTFVTGLFLCGLRSATGKIWAGVVLHMLTNSISFYLLFVMPVIGR